MTLPIFRIQPVADGYGRQHKQSATITDLDGGAPRVTARVLGSTSVYQTNWVMNATQWAYIEFFWEFTLSEGALPFQIELVSNGLGCAPHKAVFLTPPNLVSKNGDIYNVTATVDAYPVEPTSRADAELFMTLYDEYGDYALDAFNVFDRLANKQLPEGLT